MYQHISKDDLRLWSGQVDSQNTLPLVISKLINGIFPRNHVVKLQCLHGDFSNTPGDDCYVVIAPGCGNRYLPDGTSFIELSTTSKIKTKANKDYDKCTKDNASQTKDSTFIFVTPRLWKDGKAWAAEKQNTKVWKDVRVIDARELVDWLADVPQVGFWLGNLMGKNPKTGISLLEEAWDDWRNQTKKPISTELLLNGRQAEKDNLLANLANGGRLVYIGSDSSVESYGFILAALMSLSANCKDNPLLDNVLVVRDEEIANCFSNCNNLTMLIRNISTQVSSTLLSLDKNVVIPIGAGDIPYSSNNSFVLGKQSTSEFAKGLEAMGYESAGAWEAARKYSMCLTVYCRLNAVTNVSLPLWGTGEAYKLLIPAMFIGFWDRNNICDTSCICKMSKQTDYEIFEDELFKFTRIDDAPLQRYDSIWVTKSQLDTFLVLHNNITPQNIRIFKQLLIEAYIGASDGNKHSDLLLKGMTNTLLLLSTIGVTECRDILTEINSCIDDICKSVGCFSDGVASIRGISLFLPDLMEVAPLPFLCSLENAIDEHPKEFGEWLNEPFGGSTRSIMHVIWGLEALTWLTDYATHSIRVLVKLAGLCVDNDKDNRPLESLRSIFLWWYPSTCLTIAQKMEVLYSIDTSNNSISWMLILALLPSRSSIAMPIKQLSRRIAEGVPPDALDRASQLHYLSAIIDLAIKNSNFPERWLRYSDFFEYFSISQKSDFIGVLISLKDMLIEDSMKILLCSKLREMRSRFSILTSVDKDNKPAIIELLDKALKAMEPSDPIKMSLWLFNDWHPAPLNPFDSYEKGIVVVEGLRNEAVIHVKKCRGLSGLLELGSICTYPVLVASCIPKSNDLNETLSLLLMSLQNGKESSSFASALSSAALMKWGNSYKSIMLQWRDTGQIADSEFGILLSEWPDSPDSWEFAKQIGDGAYREYWKSKVIRQIQGSNAEVSEQINNLISVFRAREAIYIVAFALDQIPSEVCVTLFNAAIDEVNVSSHYNLDLDHLEEFIKNTDAREDIPFDTRVKMDYLAMFVFSMRPYHSMQIFKKMISDPDYYMEIICDAFFDSTNKERPAIDATKRRKGEIAFFLLNKCTLVAGSLSDGSISYPTLTQWIERVRLLAISNNRKAIADQLIGSMLARSPHDSEDDIWPCKAVRDAVEVFTSDSIAKGFIVECFNKRGVVSKGLEDGGKQERALSKKYQSWAKATIAGWPHLSSILSRVASMWEREGLLEDKEASLLHYRY